MITVLDSRRALEYNIGAELHCDREGQYMTKPLKLEQRAGVRHGNYKRVKAAKNKVVLPERDLWGNPPGTFPWLLFIDEGAPVSFRTPGECARAAGKMKRVAVVSFADQIVTLHHYQSERARLMILRELDRFVHGMPIVEFL